MLRYKELYFPPQRNAGKVIIVRITWEILSDDAKDTIAELIRTTFEAEELEGFKVGEI